MGNVNYISFINSLFYRKVPSRVSKARAFYAYEASNQQAAQQRPTNLSKTLNSIYGVKSRLFGTKDPRTLQQRERLKNNRFNINKTPTLHVHHTFCTFLSRFYTTTTWKGLILRFIEKRKQAKTKFYFSF